jgi:protein-tyrosine-phosphatase
MTSSVLFVCTANQCRSPMAAALFRDHLARQGFDLASWHVDSAGTWTKPGLPAAAKAIAAMANHGVDIRDHKTKEISAKLIASHELILVMELAHKEALRFEFPAWKDKIFMLSEMAGLTMDVEDPIFSEPEDFDRTVDFLQQLIQDGFARILELCRRSRPG